MLGIDPVMEGSVIFRLTKDKSINEESKVMVYPNPFLNHITIEFLNKQISKGGVIEVLDLSGRIVMKSIYLDNKNKFEFDLQALEKGIYLYKITTFEGPVFTGKINKI